MQATGFLDVLRNYVETTPLFFSSRVELYPELAEKAMSLSVRNLAITGCAFVSSYYVAEFLSNPKLALCRKVTFAVASIAFFSGIIAYPELTKSTIMLIDLRSIVIISACSVGNFYCAEKVLSNPVSVCSKVVHSIAALALLSVSAMESLLIFPQAMINASGA